MMRSSATVLLTALFVAAPTLAMVSSPNYLPFELEKRDCVFSKCHCVRSRCRLEFCFDDHVDPWVLVDSAMNKYYGVDCGQWEYWQRYEPAEYCNDGLRKGHGIFYLNRVTGSLRSHIGISYENTGVNDPSRGSVSGYCRPKKEVKCECHSKYNPEKRDCSAACD